MSNDDETSQNKQNADLNAKKTNSTEEVHEIEKIDYLRKLMKKMVWSGKAKQPESCTAPASPSAKTIRLHELESEVPRRYFQLLNLE